MGTFNRNLFADAHTRIMPSKWSEDLIKFELLVDMSIDKITRTSDMLKKIPEHSMRALKYSCAKTVQATRCYIMEPIVNVQPSTYVQGIAVILAAGLIYKKLTHVPEESIWE